MVIQERAVCAVPMEFYTGSRVLSGQISYQVGSRVSELLNGLVAAERPVKSGFIGLSDCVHLENAGDSKQERTVYVRKSAIQLAAISDSNAGRGAGADVSWKGYPLVHKKPVVVTLDLPRYTVTGNVHCREGQTILDVLDDERTFLPLTSATITFGNNLEYTRPFVAVNKRDIESIRE